MVGGMFMDIPVGPPGISIPPNGVVSYQALIVFDLKLWNLIKYYVSQWNMNAKRWTSMQYRISEGEILKFGSQISSINILWELLKMQILGPHQIPNPPGDSEAC